MEDDLKKMEDDLKKNENGRWPQFYLFLKLEWQPQKNWKTTFKKMENWKMSSKK